MESVVKKTNKIKINFKKIIFIAIFDVDWCCNQEGKLPTDKCYWMLQQPQNFSFLQRFNHLWTQDKQKNVLSAVPTYKWS